MQICIGDIAIYLSLHIGAMRALGWIFIKKQDAVIDIKQRALLHIF